MKPHTLCMMILAATAGGVLGARAAARSDGATSVASTTSWDRFDAAHPDSGRTALAAIMVGVPIPVVLLDLAHRHLHATQIHPADGGKA